MIKAVIFDLDQTLVDTSILESLRDSGQWQLVYKKIPSIKVFNNIDEVLSYIKKKEIKTAIVSSSPKIYCNKIISFLGWSFDVVIGYHDTKKRKPNPDPILSAIEKLQIEREYILSVGDRDIDILASNSSGILSGACLWGCNDLKSLLSSNPNLSFKNPMELLSYIESNS